MKRLPVKTMSKSDQRIVGEWAKEHRKTVRQLTIRQTNTKHAAGTLPLNMYRKGIQQKNNHARENVRKKNHARKNAEKNIIHKIDRILILNQNCSSSRKVFQNATKWH